MEVVNVQDHVTHAVLGGSKVQSFQIAQTAEFFQILSSSLYSDKMMALVREILCNCWDAHIESGICEIPVQVKLDHKKIVFRDFGPGIAPEEIVTRYGTYGGSTKVENSEVTGGFGLGCKAPFAYVDHFEVISCHEGEKTIYKMSLSSAMVGGRPSISTILTVPTDDTGLEVTINLKSRIDEDRFSKLIKRVAAFGEMNVMLNGVSIKSIPFSDAVHGFMLMKSDEINEASENPTLIYVRYGHVIYPLTKHDEFKGEYDRIEKFLNELDSSQYRRNPEFVLIVQAPANTVSVTPSRESLSMTDRTIETIKSLLTNFDQDIWNSLKKKTFEITEDAINKTWLMSAPRVLFQIKKEIPNIRKLSELNGHKYLTTHDQISHHYIQNKYPNFKGFRAKEILLRINALINAGFGNRGLLQSFRNAFIRSDGAFDQASQWFHRRFLKPALRGMDENPELNSKRLYVYGPFQFKNTENEFAFTLATKYPKRNFEDYLPYLRNIVIIAHRREDVYRANQFPVLRYWLGDAVGSLVYMVPRSPNKMKAAREHFENKGFVVVDLAKRQTWEPHDVTDPVTKEKAKPRKKGLPKLSTVLTANRRTINLDLATAEDVIRISAPEFIVKAALGANEKSKFADFSSTASACITRIYGDRGAIVVNSTQEKKFVDMGSKPIMDFLMEQLLREYQTNPLIKQHYENSDDGNSVLDYHQGGIFKAIKADPVLRRHFKLPDSLPERELDLVQINESFRSYERKHQANLQEIDKLIISWTHSPECEKVFKLMKDNKLLQLINEEALQVIIRVTSNLTPIEQQKARDILLLTLEG